VDIRANNVVTGYGVDGVESESAKEVPSAHLAAVLVLRQVRENIRLRHARIQWKNKLQTILWMSHCNCLWQSGEYVTEIWMQHPPKNKDREYGVKAM